MLDVFAQKIETFLTKIDLGPPEEEVEGSGAAEEEGGGVDIDQSNVFYIPDEIYTVAGGGSVDPSDIFSHPEMLG